mmetsp:Transcript_149849/g.417517  ORF Transcript_149849/g.417517 Transcript_149849/m.417517 type:complete len:202 (+) Transcript_149849:192-797(+)
MIQARKGTVISKFHVTSLDIRYKELEYFIGVFNRMSGIASMLAGFASSAMMLSVPRWESPWLVVGFLVFTGAAFGMNLLVILIATLCCLWGPGKALRGNDSAHLHDTIEILEKQQHLAMRFFVIGLFCYFLSAVLVTWIFFDGLAAFIATVLLLMSLFALVRQSLIIRRAFIAPQPYSTGYIRGNVVRSDFLGEGSSYDGN